MKPRRALALAGAALLCGSLLRRDEPGSLAPRVRYLTASASRELAVRRLGGSSAAFDRRFFFFLEEARRRLPRGVQGVALLAPGGGNSALYLAAYVLAPTPVLLSPSSVGPGWIVAVYGPERPPGWRVWAEVPGGALLTPSPPP